MHRALATLLTFITLALLPATLAQNKAEKLEVKPTNGAPARTPIKALPLTSRQGSSRSRRSAPHIINDCLTVSTEEGRFFVKVTEDNDRVCGIYFMSDPDKVVEVNFEYLDVPCQGGGLVVFVDGWELNGEVFPSPADHLTPFEDRFTEFCDAPRVKKVLVSSQNAALLQYRLPRRGHAFSFTVRHINNPRPCNILTQGTTDVHTLRNYGRNINCSLTGMFPASVRVLAMKVGIPILFHSEIETGVLYKCRKRGMDDYFEVGGSKGLDATHMLVDKDICGMKSEPAHRDSIVNCPMTTARLISSGKFDNSVTVHMEPADMEEFQDSSGDVNCPL